MIIYKKRQTIYASLFIFVILCLLTYNKWNGFAFSSLNPAQEHNIYTSESLRAQTTLYNLTSAFLDGRVHGIIFPIIFLAAVFIKMQPLTDSWIYRGTKKKMIDANTRMAFLMCFSLSAGIVLLTSVFVIFLFPYALDYPKRMLFYAICEFLILILYYFTVTQIFQCFFSFFLSFGKALIAISIFSVFNYFAPTFLPFRYWKPTDGVEQLAIQIFHSAQYYTEFVIREEMITLLFELILRFLIWILVLEIIKRVIFLRKDFILSEKVKGE